MKTTAQNHMYTRRDALKLAGLTSTMLLGGTLFAGCSSSSGSASTSASAASTTSAASAASESASASSAASAASKSASAVSAASLSGSQLNIYCGAGMTDPFTEIAELFEQKTGCKMNVTFANAAQIQTQIDTTQEGDFFIAGSAEELKPVEQYVSGSKKLVKHIPVIAVPADNPKSIAGLADLANADTLLIGDPESTPIGKIAKKALTDAGIWGGLESKGALTTTTTAPQIATALANNEGDAGIVWKENVKADGAKIVETTDLDSYVKVIPAALLSFAADEAAATEFQDFLDTSEAQDIWKKYGYELA